MHQSIAAVLVAALAIGTPVAAPHSQDRQVATDQGQSTVRPYAEAVRIAGADRYSTAAKVAESWSPGIGVVYVASGTDFPDALTAASRAGAVGAPVLLARNGGLPQATIRALERLNPQTIVVVGGAAAVSDETREALRPYARSGNVYRVYGSNRYETAAKVASKYPAGTTRVYLASGEAFPDALGTAALAGSEEVPLLLTSRDMLPSAVADELRRISPDEVIVVGGSTMVSDRVAEEAASHASDGYQRLAGTDRYETAAEVAREFPTGPAQVYVASGESYADALVGSALAARDDVPLLLTPRDEVHNAAADVVDDRSPSTLYGIGGQQSISNATLDALAGAGEAPPQDPPGDVPGWDLRYETEFPNLQGWQRRNETQSNDNSRNIPQNALPGTLGGGTGLTLLGKRESGYNRPYTSAEIHGVSDDLILPNYFRAEVVGRIPQESGIWPALLWFRPHNASDGEIDVMEYMGGRSEDEHRERFAVTMHNEYGPNQDAAKGPIYVDQLTSDSVTATHRYTIEKTPGQIKVWIDDDIEHASVFSAADKDWWNDIMEVPNRTWYPRITLQIGAGSGKTVVPDPHASWMESRVEVDSLRIWTMTP